MNRKAALASQTGNQRSRVALRRMVADALERNILDEFKSSEFERNPLIDARGGAGLGCAALPQNRYARAC